MLYKHVPPDRRQATVVWSPGPAPFFPLGFSGSKTQNPPFFSYPTYPWPACQAPGWKLGCPIGPHSLARGRILGVSWAIFIVWGWGFILSTDCLIDPGPRPVESWS